MANIACVPCTMQYWPWQYRVKSKSIFSFLLGELDSTGQPYPLDHHDRLFTEDDDADADTYDSDADCCHLRRRRALSTGGHSAS